MTFVTYKYIANKHDYKKTEYTWPDSGIYKVLALRRMAAEHGAYGFNQFYV